MQITYVTALIDLEEHRPVDKSFERYIHLFNLLQTSGIRIHLFLSPSYRGKITLQNGIIEYIRLQDLDTYRIAPNGLPENRNELHDTRNFLILMNAKTELIRRAIKSRMHSTTHYAWIDFGICQVLRTPELTLKTLCDTNLPARCLYIPGCWETPGSVFSYVNWRFCGGFFVGDKESLLDFAGRMLNVLPTLPNLAWEVNTWAHLEALGWKPTWYKADHNDSMLNIPHTSGIVRVPPNVPLYWSGGYSSCMVGSAIEQYVLQAIRRRPEKISAIFTQSDGLIGQSEFNRFLNELGHSNTGNTPAEKEYATLEDSARQYTFPIICMLCTRQFSRKNTLLLPLDDDTFNRGLSTVLQPFPSPAWEQRKPIAFWRGGSSGCDRPMLRHRVLDVLFRHPSADVAFTPGGWTHNDALIPSEYFKPERVSLAEHMKYKYILIVDGNCIASAHQWVFGSGSVPIMITHPDNDYWFKRFLKPMENYVPIKYDLSDLVEKLEWLVANDAKAKAIAEAAVQFANTIFTPEFQAAYVDSEINRILTNETSLLRSRYEAKCKIPCDINEHLPTLLKYAKRCDSITECGVCNIVSSYAFATGLLGNPNGVFKMVDPYRSYNIDMFTFMCEREGIKVKYFEESDLICPCEDTDLLFIDTWHVYAQLKRELEHWHSHVKKYIILHDTTVDEWYGEAVRGNYDIAKQSRESGFPENEIAKGLWPAIVEFLDTHPEWDIEERFTNNNGLTVLSRKGIL